MKNLISSIKRFALSLFKRDDGVTAIEYALIASAIAVVIIVAVKALGVELSSIFSSITTAL